MASYGIRIVKIFIWVVIVVSILDWTEGNSPRHEKALCKLKKKFEELSGFVEKVKQKLDFLKLNPGCVVDPLENGYVEPMRIRVNNGEMAQYSCKDWYVLKGNNTRTCQADKLGGDQPVCWRNISEHCPAKYIQYKSNVSEYKTCKGRCVTWDRAREICQEDGGDLMTVENQDEYLFATEAWFPIVGACKYQKAVWLGATDRAEEKNWTWLNGKTLETPSRYWHFGEPNNVNKNEHCLSRSCKIRTCKYNDEVCSSKLQFMCKRKFYPNHPT